MTQQERNLVGELWINVALMYGKEIQAPALKLFLNSVDDLQSVDILSALNKWIRVSKMGRHPFPSEIREMINPQLDSREVAMTLARMIDKAVTKFGYTWAWGEQVNGETYFKGGNEYHWTFKEAVIAELGPLGWHAICSKGGWQNLRDSANDMEEGTFIAQLRDQIQSSHNLAKSGADLTKIEMPSQKKQELSNEGSVNKFLNSVKEIPE